MPTLVAVPVLKPLTYQGRSYVRGEILECAAVEAAALARSGDVSIIPGTVVECDHPRGRAARRRYRRRDMSAESTSE